LQANVLGPPATQAELAEALRAGHLNTPPLNASYEALGDTLCLAVCPIQN